MVAVIFAVPAVTPVARPWELIVATLAGSLFQITTEVRSELEPSEYVPVAVNCWLDPVANFAELSGVDGVTAIEDNALVDVVVDVDVVVVGGVVVDVGVEVDEQETMPRAIIIIKPIARW